MIDGTNDKNPYRNIFMDSGYSCIHCNANLRWKGGAILKTVRYGIILGSLTAIVGAIYSISIGGEDDYVTLAIFGIGLIFMGAGLFCIPLLRLEDIE
ncbi:hypothetical protein [Kaarinaea lacus]